MQKLLTVTGLLIALGLFLAVNIVSNAGFSGARLDLTENQLYTLSEGSKNILQKLPEPITLRFYLSQQLATSVPSINSYSIRVRELLEEYQRASDGKVTLHIIEPEPFSEAEDRAMSFGLQGVPLDNASTTLYFGLAGTNSTDDEEVIPFFQPNRQEFLEYDITQLVYKLSHPKQQVIGIMSSLPIQGSAANALPFMQQPGSQEAWMIVEQIQQNFSVQTLETTATLIPDEIDVLMLVHPKGLSEATLYAIDQFVLNGGRALVFVDPYSEADTPPQNPQNPLANINAPRNSELTRLLDSWGIELTDKVVGDLESAQKVQTRRGNRMAVVDYPVWMNLNAQDHFSPDDIITGKLDDVIVATAGGLSQKEGASTDFMPLITSSDNAMLFETSRLGLFSNPEEMVRDFKAEGQFTLAARVTGSINTAFPDGKPASEATEGAETPTESPANHLAESKEAVNLIIVADTDLLQDQFWVQVQSFFGSRIPLPHAANGTFVTNALDNLGGSNDLISVRNRGSFSRPFTKVNELQKKAEMRFLETAQELEQKLQETEQKLRQLQTQRQDGNQALLSVEQQQEIDKFRAEKVDIRKELRGVQHELQKDIEHLESRLWYVNVGLMPIFVGIVGILVWAFRSSRRRGLTPA